MKKISVRPILTGKALLLLFLRNSKTNNANKDIINKEIFQLERTASGKLEEYYLLFLENGCFGTNMNL